MKIREELVIISVINNFYLNEPLAHSVASRFLAL